MPAIHPDTTKSPRSSDTTVGSMSTLNDAKDVQFQSSNQDSTELDEDSKRRREVLRGELAKMQERDDNARQRQKAYRDEERRKAKEKMRRERVEKGITILPESVDSRKFVKYIVREETKVAVEHQRKDLNAETSRMTSYIDHKLGISDLPKGDQLQALAADFYRSDHIPNHHLPEHVRKELTTREINDFRVVFDMLDAKNKGYITAEDLKRAACMLGYAGKKRIFREMIESTSKDKRGRVTFINFLELVVKLQGDGPDPYEEMVQFFRLLDKDNKGYVTPQDIRKAADELKVPLSNRAIKEMVQEADITGDGKISLDEFTNILSLAGTFRAFVVPT